MNKYKIAAILMIIHGVIVEIGGFLAILPIIFLGKDIVGVSTYTVFIVPFFQNNLQYMAVVGVIYGVVRIISAFAMWKNRLWGVALSIINCMITIILMIFKVPLGILEGVFAMAALFLILLQYFGDKRAQDWLRVD